MYEGYENIMSKRRTVGQIQKIRSDSELFLSFGFLNFLKFISNYMGSSRPFHSGMVDYRQG